MVRKPIALHTAVAAPANGVMLHDMDYKVVDTARSVIMLEVKIVTSAPTFSVQPEQSLDGTTWYSLGAAIAAVGLTQLACYTPYFRARVVSLSGGTITVVAG